MARKLSAELSQGRFFDDGDFTAEHDREFLWILEHYTEILNAVELRDGWTVTTDHSEILGEPPLDGYPPVFPDAIVTGTLVADHRALVPKLSDPTILTGRHYENVATMRVSCSGKGCKSSVLMEFKFPRYTSEWITHRRPDLVLLDQNVRKAIKEFQDKFKPTIAVPSYWNAPGYDELDKEKNRIYELIVGDYDTARAQALDAWLKAQYESPPHFKRMCFSHGFCAVIELKPTIESFGKVLRQLKIYEDRINNEKNIEKLKLSGYVLNQVILVTNDTRYDSAFKTQGISVFHIPDAKKGTNGP